MESAKNNKIGVAAKLDATMKEGVHDVRAFGLGFLRSVASIEEYQHFTQQYLEAIRAASAGNGSRLFGHFWCRYFADLYGGRALGMPCSQSMPSPRHHNFIRFP